MASHTDLDLLAELRDVPGFTELGADALHDLASSASQRRAPGGHVIIEQAATSPTLVVLVRGAAKVERVVRDESGNESEVVVLDVMRAPCIVADASIIDGQPALASVIALRASHIAQIERRILVRMLAQHPALARVLLARMAREVRSAALRIDEIVAGPVEARITRLLDSLAAAHGTPLGQGRFIAIPLRRRDLANMVHATMETVSRFLAKLEREGQARSTRDGIWWRSSTSQRPRRASDAPEVAGSPTSSARN